MKTLNPFQVLFFLVLVLTLSVKDLAAQTEPEPEMPVIEEITVEIEEAKIKKKIPVHFQIGLNAPLLFGGFLGGTTAATDNPYLASGKLLVGKIALRVAGGGKLERLIEREGEFADSRTTEDLGFDVRVGLEWQHSFGKRWIGTFGADGILFSTKEKVILDTGFDAVSTGTVTNGWGFGPALGLQFAITDRLSILTEGAFYYTQADAQTSRLFKNFPDFDDELGSVESTELKITLPATFFIVYQF